MDSIPLLNKVTASRLLNTTSKATASLLLSTADISKTGTSREDISKEATSSSTADTSRLSSNNTTNLLSILPRRISIPTATQLPVVDMADTVGSRRGPARRLLRATKSSATEPPPAIPSSTPTAQERGVRS